MNFVVLSLTQTAYIYNHQRCILGSEWFGKMPWIPSKFCIWDPCITAIMALWVSNFIDLLARPINSLSPLNPSSVYTRDPHFVFYLWWRHQMETFSMLLAICAGNSPVTSEFPSQRPVTRSFGVYFDLRIRLSKVSWGWWFEAPSRSLWHHCKVCLQMP